MSCGSGVLCDAVKDKSTVDVHSADTSKQAMSCGSGVLCHAVKDKSTVDVHSADTSKQAMSCGSGVLCHAVRDKSTVDVHCADTSKQAMSCGSGVLCHAVRDKNTVDVHCADTSKQAMSCGSGVLCHAVRDKNTVDVPSADTSKQAMSCGSGVLCHAVRDKNTVDVHSADTSKRGMSYGSNAGEPTCQNARVSKSVCVSSSGVEDGRSEVCTDLSGTTGMHSQHLTDLEAHTATLPPDLHPATLRSPSSSKRSERSCAVKDAQEADRSVIVMDSDGEEEVCVAVETGGSVGRDEADRWAKVNSQVDIEADHRAGVNSQVDIEADHRAGVNSQVDIEADHRAGANSQVDIEADHRAGANSQVDVTPAQLGQPHHGVADIVMEAEYKADVQRLREALSSGEEDAPGDLDLDFLAALPASQVTAVCQAVGLAAVRSFLLPAVLQQVVTLSSKLSHGASTALVQAIITHTFLSMGETASRDVTSCLSDLAVAFPLQLAAVLCDCLHQAPLSSVQAEVMSSIIKNWDPAALLCFVRGVCVSDRQVDQHLVTVLQSAVSRRVDLNPDDLLALLRALETGAAPLAADVKYGRLVLTLVRTHRNQMTSLHSAVLHSIASVHTSLVRKSLRSLVDSLPS